MVVDTERETVDQSLERILDALERRGHVWRGVRERLLPEAEHASVRSLPRLEVGPREVSDALMLASGAFSPLEGFLRERDYAAVL